MKVLVIDDDPVALALTRAVLESWGHDVVTLEGALGASAVILREKPRVVVLDIEMPGLCGDEWLHMLRERKLLDAEAPPVFILHSGARAADLDRLASETGALGAIPKDDDSRAFGDAFERLVEGLPA